MSSTYDDEYIMRDIALRECRTFLECIHVIREYYRTADDVQSCYNRIFTNGWISTRGAFVYINPSKKHEWKRIT